MPDFQTDEFESDADRTLLRPGQLVLQRALAVRYPLRGPHADRLRIRCLGGGGTAETDGSRERSPREARRARRYATAGRATVAEVEGTGTQTTNGSRKPKEPEPKAKEPETQNERAGAENAGAEAEGARAEEGGREAGRVQGSAADSDELLRQLPRPTPESLKPASIFARSPLS